MTGALPVLLATCVLVHGGVSLHAAPGCDNCGSQMCRDGQPQSCHPVENRCVCHLASYTTQPSADADFDLNANVDVDGDSGSEPQTTRRTHRQRGKECYDCRYVMCTNGRMRCDRKRNECVCPPGGTRFSEVRTSTATAYTQPDAHAYTEEDAEEDVEEEAELDAEPEPQTTRRTPRQRGKGCDRCDYVMCTNGLMRCDRKRNECVCPLGGVIRVTKLRTSTAKAYTETGTDAYTEVDAESEPQTTRRTHRQRGKECYDCGYVMCTNGRMRCDRELDECVCPPGGTRVAELLTSTATVYTGAGADKYTVEDAADDELPFTQASMNVTAAQLQPTAAT